MSVNIFYFSDNLRELCNTFRHLLYELAKCVSVCEKDLNATLIEELNKFDILPSAGTILPFNKSSSRPNSPQGNDNELNQSTCSSIFSQANRSMHVAIVPDVSGILSLIEDPSLINFVAEKFPYPDDDVIDIDGSSFNLNDCLEKLKTEADSLLHLSEKMVQKKLFHDNRDTERNDSCEEEDGLKSKKSGILSLNNSFATKDDINLENGNQKHRFSLPIFVPLNSPSDKKLGSTSELNELKNRLVLAERKRQDLEKELIHSKAGQTQLAEDLRLATIKLNSYIDGHSEELSEG